MRRLLLSAVVAGLTALAVPMRADPPDFANAANAVTKSEEGDAEGAAAIAGRNNTASHGTLGWYHQSALQLVQLAYSFKGAQDDASARRAATTAVAILMSGQNKKAAGSQAADRSQTWVLLGQIYEDLLGDRTDARTCFVNAAKEDPDNPIAKQANAGYAADDENKKRLKKGK